MNSNLLQPPHYLGIAHVGIAVPQNHLEEQLALYREIGFREVGRADIGDELQLREVMLRIGDSENYLQLLAPLADSSPLAKFINNQSGNGAVNHIAYRVSDIVAARDYYLQQDFRLVSDEIRTNPRGERVLFLHPRLRPEISSYTLIEIVENIKDDE